MRSWYRASETIPAPLLVESQLVWQCRHVRIMTQQWRDLLFVHWSYEPDHVRQLLPEHLRDRGVELDTFEGRAYVGLVPFQMHDLRLRGFVPIPTTSHFPEINVRTYVTFRGRPSVWFFSLDTSSLLATMTARIAFRLPYCFARASVTVTGEGDGAMYESRVERRWPDRATSSLVARIGAPIPPTPLTDFLTARWGLVTTTGPRRPATDRRRRGRFTFFGAIEHEPWPLHDASLVALDDHLVEAAGLAPGAGTPIVHYSPGVTTSINSLEFIRAVK